MSFQIPIFAAFRLTITSFCSLNLNFQKKGGGLPKLDWSRDVTGRVNILQSVYFSRIRAEGTDSRFSKPFRRDISLQLLNIFETAAPNENKKFQKLYFDFS